MKKSEKAVELFKSGFSCSQSVLGTYAEELGITKETAYKISCGFGGGCSRMGIVCGAVSGAYMVIGLMHGKSKPEDNISKEKTYELVNLFTQKFKEKHCSINCRDLTNIDLSTPEGMKKFEEDKIHDKVCYPAVETAIDILEEITK